MPARSHRERGALLPDSAVLRHTAAPRRRTCASPEPVRFRPPGGTGPSGRGVAATAPAARACAVGGAVASGWRQDVRGAGRRDTGGTAGVPVRVLRDAGGRLGGGGLRPTVVRPRGTRRVLARGRGRAGGAGPAIRGAEGTVRPPRPAPQRSRSGAESARSARA